MLDYLTRRTSSEVFAVISAAHPELVIFETRSEPERGRMFTAYGFADANAPIMQALTTWDIDPDTPAVRKNETHQFWLCLPIGRKVRY